MELSRRDFLKLSGGAAGAAVALSFLPDTVFADTSLLSHRTFPLKQWVKETTTICCYCSVGCGALVNTYEDGVIKTEGDPDHPINEGTLCPKGQAMAQIHQVDGEPNPRRLTKPLYRAAGGTVWEEKDWSWMMETIADRIKATRDANWKPTIDAGGTTYNVNRTDAIANFGGGELDNEECYILAKMARALGIVYLEHCARL
jgi:formate dehydrogenase major subunit